MLSCAVLRRGPGAAVRFCSSRGISGGDNGGDARVGPFLSLPPAGGGGAGGGGGGLVAVLFGWAGARDAHLRKYAAAAVAAGATGGALRLTAPAVDLFFRRARLRALAEAALDGLQAAAPRAPLLLWYASNGGAFMHEEIVAALARAGADARWPGLRARIAAVCFDSAPAALTPTAFARAATRAAPGALQSLVAAAAAVLGFALACSARPAAFWRAMLADDLPAPVLYIYSPGDDVTDAAAVDALIAARRASHVRGAAAVRAWRLPNSPHVGHLRSDPARYAAELAALCAAARVEDAAQQARAQPPLR